MNSYLNGEYLQIEEELNFFVNKNTSAERLEQIKENVFLIHYAGSKKPWTFEGSVDKASYYYQNLNIKYLNSYHLISTYKRKDFLLIIIKILNLKILNSPKPLKLIYDSISNLLLNDKEKLKIDFASFWPNFVKHDNYFYHLLEQNMKLK